MTARTEIPFGRPWITDEDRKAVLDVLNGHILTHGPQGKGFEQDFVDLMGGGHAVAVSSCTAALHLAYFQMKLGPGDEVIVPAQTHNATAHAVEMVGARPVFVDCEPQTGNIDVALIEASITPKTKAISLVHFVGIPCDMDAVVAIAERHGLRVVEDCALALGARYRGKHVGLIGDAGCFSFYPVKHITTGDGGMFVTKHQDVAEAISRQRAFGVDRTHSERSVPGFYDVTELGFNYRMSEMQAALGRNQLLKIDPILERRARNFADLKSIVSSLPDVHVLDSVDDAVVSSHYCLTVVLGGNLGELRGEVVRRLNEAGVGTSIYYPHPVPRLTYYKEKYGYDGSAYPNAAAISDHSVALPVGPHLTPENVAYIGATFKRVIEMEGS